MDTKIRYIVVLSLLPYQVAFADMQHNASQTSNEAKQEDVMVVSASRTQQSLWNAPVTMQVINSDEIRKFSGDSVTELLRDIPGVDVTDGSMPGRKQLRIRGEVPDRVLILIDGQDVSYQRANSAGLLIDSESLERIEVVKGPHSVLYGARAIGGVVNFITRKGGSRPLQGDAKVGYDTSAEGNFQSGSLYGSAHGFDYRLSGSHYNYGDRRAPGGRLKDTDFGNETISGWLGYHSNKSQFGVSLDHMKLDTQAYSARQALTSNVLASGVSIPKMVRKKVGLFYDYEHDGSFWQKLHIDAFNQAITRDLKHLTVQRYGGNGRPTGTTSVNLTTYDKQVTKGATLQLDFAPFNQDKLIIGSQYLHDHVDQDSLIKIHNTTHNGTVIPIVNRPSIDAWEQKSTSVFIQNEWQFADNWIWTLGGRQYWLDSKFLHGAKVPSKTSDTDSTLVGATSLRYSGIEDTELRLSYAQGYVYPTLFKQFAISAGTYGNPNLKAEKSDNIEFGVRYKGNNWLLDSALYYSKAHDYITQTNCTENSQDICQDSVSTDDKYYINADKAKTYGMELTLEYNKWDIVPYLSGNIMRREVELTDRKTHRTGDPLISGKIGAKNTHYFNFVDLESNVYFRMAGHSNNDISVGHESANHRGGWSTANLEFNGYMGQERQYRIGLQLNNLLDHRYMTAHETIPSAGFSAILSAGLTF